jgi:hypothetical protein
MGAAATGENATTQDSVEASMTLVLKTVTRDSAQKILKDRNPLIDQPTPHDLARMMIGKMGGVPQVTQPTPRRTIV